MTFLLFSLKSFGQSGLHFSAEELAIWRQRAGLSSGQTLYKSTGDVSSYSPGDWDRILADALTAVSNSANDRFTNYDTSKGLNSPITELSAASNRKSEVDDREPRPNINSRDYGALSIQNAGFVYQMIGGDGGNISGKKGTEFANAVRTEMLWYASNQWLDFTNSNRWSLSKPFYDRNPGFFIACWLNTVVNAYDYTRGSSVYSSSEKAKIETWLLNASKFYFSMLTKYTTLVFPNYASNEYSVTTNSWPDNVRGEAWSGSPYTSYGINESYSNRTTAMWRFVMRASILLKNNSSHGSQAKTQISAAKRWVKEWIVFGTFSDGTFADSHRGDTSYPQKGLSYTSVALGSIVDMIDAYVRNQQSDSDYENLYEWQLKPGTSEYNKYFPSSTSSRAWRKSIELSEPKGIKKIITTYLKHFDGSYGNTRRWGTYNIDGYSAPSSTPRKIEMDRWVALANIYYQDNYIKSIYTRTASGTRGYSSNPTSAGSYPINIGSWGSHPGTLFMFGQMEGKVWPYSGSSSKPVTDTKILNVASSLSFGSVVLGESTSKDLIIQNTGNSTLTISKVSSNNNQFVCSYSGSIAAGASVTVSVTYQPTTEGAQTGEIEITSDKTSGNNVITLSGTGTLDLSNENTKTVHKIEAENSGFTVLVDSGSKSSIEKTEDNSSFLSDSKAIKLYDNGDKVRYTFSLPEEGIFQLHVRVRSGNVTNSTAYWPDAYSFSLDDNGLAMTGDESTVSGQDYNFGTSYWGTMKSTSMSLAAGNHTLDIEALSTWGLIDYIEVIQIGVEEEEPETKILSVASSLEFGEVNAGESITKTLTLSNSGNSDLTISEITSTNGVFSSSFSGVIATGESVDVEVSFLSDEAGEFSSELTIVSDKTEGNSTVILNAIAISTNTNVTTYSVKLEAEDIYVAKTDVGSKSKVSESDETSTFLSGETAVRLYDSGDAVSLPFNIPADGTYTVNVRLRSGDRTSSTSYFESAYNFELNGNSTALKGIYDSVSEEDESFGISYWGTMTTGEMVLSKGENVLTVISKMNWVLVDYIEVIGESEFPISVAVSDTEIDFEEVELDQIAAKTVIIENTGM
ncbi:MAG: hypothetical protein CMO01_31415, partial [Thalassobius sp.]|nr:hypothetical protein [Thalassovita sp.]